jgi:hypothetical protein
MAVRTRRTVQARSTVWPRQCPGVVVGLVDVVEVGSAAVVEVVEVGSAAVVDVVVVGAPPGEPAVRVNSHVPAAQSLGGAVVTM